MRTVCVHRSVLWESTWVAETIKVVELISTPRNGWACKRRVLIDHSKEPGPVLLKILQDWDWDGIASAAITGRFGGQILLPQVPTKQAQAHGCRYFYTQDPCTVVSIGSHGFSVLELRDNGIEVFRENSRCSQGTGNFLRQLVERFGLNIEEASALSAASDESAPLSGRCPVILKTDMTHLANKGGKPRPYFGGGCSMRFARTFWCWLNRD